MRRSRSTLIVAMTLAVCAVAGQARAGQGRPRSAPPPSSSRGSSSQSTQGEKSGESTKSSQPSQPDRGRSSPQAQRREAPVAPVAPQAQQPQPPQPSQQPRAQQAPPQARNDARPDYRANNNGRTDTRAVMPQRESAPPRQAVPAPRDRYVSRNDGHYDDRYDSRYDNRGYNNGYPYDNHGPNYRYSGSHVIIAPRYPVHFSASWFTFRPYFRMSIGLTMGYPIAFPTWYDPYMVGTPGYARPYMAYGGVSFNVEPRDADLWVDGDFIGRVSDYSPYDPPLTLVAGRHHVELTGRNYQSIAFDITVVAGQVIPYQGTLPYYR